MITWYRALNVGLRVLTLIGHLAVLFFALAAAAAYGTLGIGLLVIAIIAFVVVNVRVIFPWPERRQEMQGNFRLARLTLWIVLPLALLFCAAGVINAYPFKEWLGSFLILATTSALNLLVLHLSPRVDS